jgi:O-antigen/teichoic acid export membrane protein
MDVFLINLFLNPAAAGIYFIAVQIVERLWMLSHGAAAVLLPRVAALHEDESKRRLLTPLVSRMSFWLTFAGACVVAAISFWLIPIIFGQEYANAYQALLILLPGVVLVGLSRVLSNDINARGRPDTTMWIAIAVFLVNCTANVLLIPRFGINGAALATSIAYLTHAILTTVMYCKYAKIGWLDTCKFQLGDIKLFLRRRA